MKYKILIIIFIFFELQLSAHDIHNYDFIKIATFIHSSDEGGLGYKPEIGAGIPNKPVTFTISIDEKVYVCDTINFRINVYDLNF